MIEKNVYKFFLIIVKCCFFLIFMGDIFLRTRDLRTQNLCPINVYFLKIKICAQHLFFFKNRDLRTILKILDLQI